MKPIIYSALFTLLISAAAFGQAQDTSASKQNQENAGQMQKDKFIDRDGDGICDRREEGLGFKKGKHGMGRQRGKSQDVQAGKGSPGTVNPTGSGTGKNKRGGSK